MTLSDNQKAVIAKATEGGVNMGEAEILAIAAAGSAEDLPTEKLVAFLQAANATYRAGEPIIKDDVYDHVFRAALAERAPGHSFLHEVEPEMPQGKTVELPARMLSTQKAYTTKELQAWLDRLEKAGAPARLETVNVKATPKLDGFAAYDDGERLYSRGDGKRGTDITRAFERGLKVGGDGVRGQGPGEIVIRKSYFEQCMAEFFDNSRNVQAAILAEKKVDATIQRAIDDGAALFMPFAQLQAWTGTTGEVVASIGSILQNFSETVDFDIDGVVLETTHPEIRQALGSARSHHRWQLAYKVNDEGVPAQVLDVVPNTSRLGRVNPVALIEPIRVSGVMIGRVTAHHYGMVRAQGLGPGARIRIVRSGLVIPKIVGVLEAVEPRIPTQCPSCASPLAWQGDYLFCGNSAACPAQTSTSLEHFFKTMKNVDGFGPQTLEQLYRHGIRRVSDVYALNLQTLQDAGFGDKTAQNLLAQLKASREIAVDDSRFLAAFGVVRLGEGNAEKLLARVPLEKIFDLTAAEVSAIPGFADVTADTVVAGLVEVREEFETVYRLGFNLRRTPMVDESAATASPIAGKSIVFTGKMRSGRDALERQAKSLGAKVGGSVTGKTWLLVTGEDVGAAKTQAAADKNVRVVSEEEYLRLIGDGV
ncbi:MAG: helix-hairpin-helix domain-containing protein [Panacagrimonas sp.]